MKHWLLIIAVLTTACYNNLLAQQGFNTIFNQYSAVDNFARLIVVEDTIYGIGSTYDTTITPSPLQLLMVKFDTLGNVIQSKLYRDSLDAFLSLDFLVGNIIHTARGNLTFSATIFGRASTGVYQIDHSLEMKSVFEYPKEENLTEFYYQMIEMPDGGFLIVGYVQRPNFLGDGFIRRVDNQGNVLWFKYYGQYTRDEAFTCISKVNDNRFVVGGWTQSIPNVTSSYRAALWAIDSNGVLLETWEGPATPNLISVKGLRATPDGGFVAHGRTYWGEGQFGSKVQISLMKFNAALQLQWLQHIGPNTSNYNGIMDMTLTPDGHYIVAGQRTSFVLGQQPSTDWGGWLYKFSEQGDSLWARADNAPPGFIPTGEYVHGGVGILSSGSVVAGGKGDIDDKFVGWVIKVSADGCMDTLHCKSSVGVSLPELNAGLSVWPNPTTEYFRIGLEAPAGRYCLLMLHDLSGRLLQTVPIPEGTLVYTVSLEGVPEGMCMLSVTEAGKVLGREKLVVQRF
jgi:hypothetical protein